MKTLNGSFDSFNEIEAYIDKCKIEDSSSLLIQIFSGWTDKEKIESIIQLVTTKLPSSIILGSTTDGEISNGHVSTHKVSVSFTKFEKTKLKLEFLKQDNMSSFEMGSSIVKKLISDKSKAIILFAAGLKLDGEAILNGIKEYDHDVIITGGMAADNSLFKTPFVFCKEGVYTDCVMGVSLDSDDLIANTSYSFDWELIGKSMIVTHSEGNRIYTIDGISTVDIYKKYLGEETAMSLPASGSEFPLVLIRNGVNVARAGMLVHEDGSLTVAGGVQSGDTVKFAFGSPEMIVNPSTSVVNTLVDTTVESIFIYSCMGRRRFMPDIIEQEIQPIETIAPTSGFFTYGEFYHHENTNELLNQTMTILALSEKKEKPNRKKINTQKLIPSKNNYTSTVRALSYFVNSTFDEMEQLNLSLSEASKKRNEQEKLLMQQSRYAAMGEMISSIAHQWRQPINALNLVIANIKDAYKFGKLNEEFLDRSVTKSNRLIQKMSTTIDDFRDFFKPEKESTNFSIEEVVMDAVNLLDGVFKNFEIVIETDFAENINVSGYPNEFSQAILNILNNAKDAMILKEIFSKKILIKLWQDKESIYLSIEDTAGGIPESIIEKIFDPYFTTKETADGTGIGLYMTQAIIRDHMHGSICVRNSDKGAVFTIKLNRTGKKRGISRPIC